VLHGRYTINMSATNGSNGHAEAEAPLHRADEVKDVSALFSALSSEDSEDWFPGWDGSHFLGNMNTPSLDETNDSYNSHKSALLT
jgi:hypothetical protein